MARLILHDKSNKASSRCCTKATGRLPFIGMSVLKLNITVSDALIDVFSGDEFHNQRQLTISIKICNY